MQIKVRGHKLALIRSEYVPEKKRTVGRFVASFDKWASKIPEDVRAKLTDAEAQEVDAEICRRRAERDADIAKMELLNLPRTLNAVADQIEDGEGNEPSDDHVQDIYAGIDRLQKVLRSRGFKRIKAPKGKKGQDESQDAGDDQNNLI